MSTERTLHGIGRFDWERILERVPAGATGVKPTTKHVGWVLAHYADAATGRRIWPGRNRLAAVVGKSVRTIDGALDELCRVGLIEVVKKGGRGVGGRGYATEYRLTFPDDLTRQMALLDLDNTQTEVPFAGQAQPAAPGGDWERTHQAQPIAAGPSDQLQLTATDQNLQAQTSNRSVATMRSTTGSRLHPINQSYINQEFINQGTSTADLAKRPDLDSTDLGLSPQLSYPASHHCDAGWIGQTQNGDLIPCLRCKPHLHHGRDGWKVSRSTDVAKERR